MAGNIYTNEKCPLCGGTFVHDERRRGLFCRNHPGIAAKGPFIVRFGRKQTNQRRDYGEALRLLTGLRFKTDEGLYDYRDYQREQPLGFTTQAEKYLRIKAQTMKPGGLKTLRKDLRHAMEAWGQRNVKGITYGDFEDLLATLPHLSGKSRHNLISNLGTLFRWLCRRENIPMPELPKVEYTLGWREIIDRDTQASILEEIKRLTWDRNPRIWLAVQWLATYVSIRPVELLRLRERDVDVDGMLVLRPETTKEKKPKIVPLLSEDVELIRSWPRGLPDMPFFRHLRDWGPARTGHAFSEQMLYKRWKEACANLGIKGVDLYGGTRHSTATAMRAHFTRDQLRGATMHGTDKAFDRYVQNDLQPSVEVYAKARSTQRPTSSGPKIIPLKPPR